MEELSTVTTQSGLEETVASVALLVTILFFVFIIDLVLKAMACWKSAQLKEKGWFIALFILNTAGILPAIYLILRREKK